MAGLVPAIHVFTRPAKTWMPGTRPGMTIETEARSALRRFRLPGERALLRLGELLGRHLACHRVAVLHRGGAVAGVGRGKARGGEIEPHVRLDDVLRHALAARVGQPEI